MKLDAEGLIVGREQPAGAPVEVVSCDDLIPGLQGHEDRINRGKATGEGQAVPTALQRGEGGLEGVPGRVGGSAVFISLVLADALLHVSGGHVDRRHDRSGGGVGLHARMDREGAESGGLLLVGHASKFGTAGRFAATGPPKPTGNDQHPHEEVEEMGGHPPDEHGHGRCQWGRGLV